MNFEDWRRQVRFMIQARTEWQVIAEASGGSEAVQNAEELRPDFNSAGHRSPQTEWNRNHPEDTTTL
jgi:DNA-binding NarL/FixJ family response regulator